jgi:hypothetical protein
VPVILGTFTQTTSMSGFVRASPSGDLGYELRIVAKGTVIGGGSPMSSCYSNIRASPAVLMKKMELCVTLAPMSG